MTTILRVSPSEEHISTHPISSVLPDIIIGVDTHKDTHVAAALTLTGQVVGTQSFPTTRIGFESLLALG